MVAILSNRIQMTLPLYKSPTLEASVWTAFGYEKLRKIANLVGESTLQDIAKEHVRNSRSCGHVYRKSDVANRHDHSNSHPNPALRYTPL
jgi:hypothetical protein